MPLYILMINVVCFKARNADVSRSRRNDIRLSMFINKVRHIRVYLQKKNISLSRCFAYGLGDLFANNLKDSSKDIFALYHFSKYTNSLLVFVYVC